MDRDETIKLTIKSLLEVVQTGAKNIEIAVMEPGKQLEMLKVEEIEKFVEGINNEKADEDAKKPGRRTAQGGAAAGQAPTAGAESYVRILNLKCFKGNSSLSNANVPCTSTQDFVLLNVTKPPVQSDGTFSCKMTPVTTNLNKDLSPPPIYVLSTLITPMVSSPLTMRPPVSQTGTML